MKKVFKWVLRISIVLVVLVVVVVGALAALNFASWPTVSGELEVEGLQEKVEIIRDEWDIPHIYAENEHDLFFAQGYVHAQDRLFQMESNRRSGLGELSKIFGKRTVGVDRFFKTIGLHRSTKKSLELMDPRSLAILEAYSEGVNAYIQSHRLMLPLEFLILGNFEMEPWTPLHSLAFGSSMAFSLSGNMRLELLRANMVANFGKEATERLFPHNIEDSALIIPDGIALYDGFKNFKSKVLAELDEIIGETNAGWGSNNWVIHGSKTKSGKPILANDIHLGTQFPSIWYGVGLHGGDFDSVGYSFPGVPLTVVGHNKYIAWGTSNLSPDTEDVYLEKLDDPKNPTKYEYNGEWHDLEIIEEAVEVKGGDSVPFKVYLTKNGPLANKTVREEDLAPFSLRWPHAEGNRLFSSIVSINLAKNWGEFREAAKKWDSPGQNLVYADVEGNIGYQATGKVPLRKAGHNGLLPVPGWTDQYAWSGYIPFEEMPSSFNPPQGFIATANNKIVSDDYPHQLALDWYPGFRAKRISDLISAQNDSDFASVRKTQADTFSIPAERLMPFLLTVTPKNDLEKKAYAALKQWDLYFEIDRVGAAIYEAWFVSMVKNTVMDELGEKYGKKYLSKDYQRHSSQIVPMLIGLMKEPNHALFDDQSTTTVETREEIIRKSFVDAIELLKKKVGDDVDQWTWGKIHTVSFEHIAFRRVPVLKNLFNTSKIPARGDQFTVNEAGFSWNNPFKVNHAVSQRMIIDLGDWDQSEMIEPVGQPMQLFHPRREASMKMWQNLEYHPMGFSKDKIMETNYNLLTLEPK